MKQRYYIFLCIFSCCLLFVGSQTSGYFEDSYKCTITDNLITVSIATGALDCFAYIGQLTDSLDTVTENIQAAQDHLDDGDDVFYRTQVMNDLTQQERSVVQLRQQFLVAVDDYEFELFLKVKSLAGFYLFPRREELTEKRSKAGALLINFQLLGDMEQYAFVRNELEKIEQELILLDRIKTAYDFASLMPALKLYILGGYDAVSSNNEDSEQPIT